MADKMNPVDRVVLSRETLYKYRMLPELPSEDLEWYLKQIGSELTILQGIAEGTPQDREAIDLLMEAWQDFASLLKRKAN